MSHARGEVIKNGEIVGLFEYNATSEMAISAIHDTKEVLDTAWRSYVWNECKCGNEPESVLLYTNYGDGFYWPAEVCFTCRAITKNTMPYEEAFELMKNGHPLKSSKKQAATV